MNNLLDDLLQHFRMAKSFYRNYRNREHFVELVFPEFELFSGIKTPLFRSEIYNTCIDYDFRNNKNCYAYMFGENDSCKEYHDKTWKQIRMEKIGKFIEECQKEGALNDLKAILMELLKKTDIHDYKLIAKLVLSIEKLKTSENCGYLDNKMIDNWKKNIYYYFYFAVTDKLHSDAAFSLYPELDKDLEEYNQKVTMMYGAAGNPGMYQLYALANKDRPNIIALYECGELEYYGKGPSGKISFEKAYEYYERTKKCNKDHPLASWSIAYIRFHYDQNLARVYNEYRISQLEEELKNGKRNSWYDKIIHNVEIAYDHGCSAAANLLGKIIDSTDEIFPIARRGKFADYKSIDLYKESADAGYVFGCNNYAQACLNKANKIKNKQEQRDLSREAIKYLEKSALLGNPWASNKMGLYYFKGLIVGGERILKEDKELAYKHFKYATIMMHAESYYWPLINLCKKYWINADSDKYGEVNLQKVVEFLELTLKNMDNEEKEQKAIIQELVLQIKCNEKIHDSGVIL